LRPSLEDWLGAGAIVNYLPGTHSPEARSAAAAFTLEAELGRTLEQCGSGKELLERGYAEDVRLAAQLNVSEAVPHLLDGAYTLFEPDVS
jgi:2-phosphosulfolactate phosphatase